MIQKFEPVRVVNSWCGQGTAETVYEDQYGRVWRERPYGSSNGTTGVQRATLQNGIITPISP